MATLLIDIEARLSKFQDSLDQVSRNVERQVSSMQRAFGALGTTFAAVGAAVGAGAIGQAVGRIVNQMAELDDAAEKSGASVESLSSILNTLAPTGVSLEQITDITSKLTRAMAGAGEESSKAAAAFKALGVETTDSNGNLRSVDDVLTDLAQSLSQYEDSANKTALAQALLGKTGAEYLPLLKDLATRQREAATVSTEQAAAAEKLANAWRSLGTQATMLAQELGGPILERLVQLIDQFRVGKEAANGFFNALARYGLATGSPEENIDRIRKRIDELNAAIQKDESLAQGNGSAFGRGARSAAEGRVKAYRAEVDQLVRDLQYFRLLQEQAGGTTNLKSDKLYAAPGGTAPAPAGGDDKTARREQLSDGERLVQQLEDRLVGTLKLTEAEKLASEIARGRIKFDTQAQQQAAETLAIQIDSVNRINDASKLESDAAIRRIKLYEDREEAESKAAEAAQKAAEAEVENFLDLADPARKYIKQLERISELYDKGFFASEADADRVRAIISGQIDALDEQVEKTKEARSVADELGLTFSSAFEDAILKGEQFSKVLQGIAQDIARIALRKTVTEPLAELVTGALGGLFSGGGPENIGAPINPAVELPGVLRGGKSYIPNAGVTVNQTVNIDSRTDRASILQAMAATKQLTEASIVDARLRGATV